MQSTLLSFLGQKEVYPTIFYIHNYNVDFLNNIPKWIKLLLYNNMFFANDEIKIIHFNILKKVLLP